MNARQARLCPMLDGNMEIYSPISFGPCNKMYPIIYASPYNPLSASGHTTDTRGLMLLCLVEALAAIWWAWLRVLRGIDVGGGRRHERMV